MKYNPEVVKLNNRINLLTDKLRKARKEQDHPLAVGLDHEISMLKRIKREMLDGVPEPEVHQQE